MKKVKFIAAFAAAFALAALVLAGCSSSASSSASSSDKSITSLEDLDGKIVMTQVDSAALEVLKGDSKDLADTFAELQTIDTYDNAFMQLESGAVDAVACDLSYATYRLAKDSGKFTVLSPSLQDEHYAVAFKLGDADLAEQVTATLQKLDEEGVVEALCEKYEEEGISYENWVLPKAASGDAVQVDSDVTLIVGFDAGYPPYGYVGDDGEYTGFDLELAQAVCDENGWTFQAEAIDWDAKDALLQSGVINCIWNGFTMEGREANYTLSEPYMLNGQVIVVNK